MLATYQLDLAIRAKSKLFAPPPNSAKQTLEATARLRIGVVCFGCQKLRPCTTFWPFFVVSMVRSVWNGSCFGLLSVVGGRLNGLQTAPKGPATGMAGGRFRCAWALGACAWTCCHLRYVKSRGHMQLWGGGRAILGPPRGVVGKQSIPPCPALDSLCCDLTFCIIKWHTSKGR